LDDLAEIRFFVTCDRRAAFREQFKAIEEQCKRMLAFHIHYTSGRSLLCVSHFRFAVCQYQSPSRDTGCSRSVSVSENQQSCMMQYSPIMSTMMMSVIQEAVQALLQRHDHYDVSQLIRIIQKYRKTRGLQLPLRQLQQHARRHSSIMCGGIIVIRRMGIRGTTALAPPACCHFWRLVFVLLVVLPVRMSDRNIHRSRNVNSKPLLLHRHCRLLSLFKPLTFLSRHNTLFDVWNFQWQSTVKIPSSIKCYHIIRDSCSIRSYHPSCDTVIRSGRGGNARYCFNGGTESSICNGRCVCW